MGQQNKATQDVHVKFGHEGQAGQWRKIVSIARRNTRIARISRTSLEIFASTCTLTTVRKFNPTIFQGKKTRKSMAMYTHVFGFRTPYRVLCDGTFLQAALDMKLFVKV